MVAPLSVVVLTPNAAEGGSTRNTDGGADGVARVGAEGGTASSDRIRDSDDTVGADSDDTDEPICRICFSGVETGKLIAM